MKTTSLKSYLNINFKIPILFFVYLYYSMLSASAAGFLGDLAFIPPQAGYQVYKTQNFRIIYPKHLEIEADQSAYFLEQAHQELNSFYQYNPNHRVTVILADNQDLANGITSAIGLQGMILYMTNPDPYLSIGEYEHWLKNLIFHEYTHYLTLEQTRGIFKFARYFFGDLLLPNHAWPAWLAEGFSVYAESHFTKSGRGNGALYSTLTLDALNKNSLLNEKFLPFNKSSGIFKDYPFGESAYFVGYAMISQLEAELYPQAQARFAQESSWRFPFFLNGTLENISGEKSNLSFHTLWTNWGRSRFEFFKNELDWIKNNPSQSNEPTFFPDIFTEQGIAVRAARFSKDEKKVAVLLQSGHERPSLQLLDLESNEREKLDEAISSGSVDWHPNKEWIYYSKVDYSGPFAFYSDLYRYDLNTHSSKKLTQDERAKDPSFCPKSNPKSSTSTIDERLVYTTQNGHIAELKLIDLSSSQSANEKKIITLYRAPDFHHLSNPRCLNNQVYFSEHTTKPLEQAMVHDLNTHQTSAFMQGNSKFGAQYLDPTDEGIYFTKVENNHYDLALWKNGQIKTLRHSAGGYWMPHRSKTKTLVTYVSSQGLQTGYFNNNDLTPIEIPKQPEIISSEKPKTQVSVAGEKNNYNLLTSLQPRIWSPYLTYEDERIQAGATVLGWDDTDQLEYNLLAWYDSIPKKPQGIFSTFHRTGLLGLRINLSASSQITDYAVFSNSQKIYNEERKLSMEWSRPFPSTFSYLTPGLVAEWARTWRGFTNVPNRSGFAFSPDYRLGMSLSYSNMQRFPYSITNEHGTYAKIEARRFFQEKLRANKMLVQVQQNFSLIKHASLALQIFGALAPTPQFGISESAVKIGGRGTLSDLDPPLRGYPLGNFQTRRAGVFQAELRLPLAQIFSGYETLPIFLQNLGAYGFYDGAKIQKNSGDYTKLIDATGGGLIINTVLAYAFPLQVRLEFSHGLQNTFGAQNSFALYLNY